MPDQFFETEMSPKDIPTLASWLSAQKATLELPTDRLSFLVSLVFLNKHQLDGVFQESTLVESFIACDRALGGRDDNRLTRANHAINDLVAQRLLIRFSDSLVHIAAIYRLTPLGLAISEHYLHTQKFSSISLASQLQQVSQKISEAVEGSTQGGTLAQWQERVFVPLRYLVAEIFDRIDATQRSLDLQQLQTKKEISSLLHERWDRALHLCEKLLAETSAVLEELKETLHAVGDDVQSGLMTIRQHVLQREELSFIGALVNDLQAKFDQIFCWGERTIELWARYDRRVHKFLRTAIAIDKDRHFSEALRQSILDFPKNPWRLNLVSCAKLVECLSNKHETYPIETLGTQHPFSQMVEKDSDRDVESLFKAWKILDQKNNAFSAHALEEFLSYALEPIAPEDQFQEANRLVQWWMALGYSTRDQSGKMAPWRLILESALAVQAHPLDRFYEVL